MVLTWRVMLVSVATSDFCLFFSNKQKVTSLFFAFCFFFLEVYPSSTGDDTAIAPALISQQLYRLTRKGKVMQQDYVVDLEQLIPHFSDLDPKDIFYLFFACQQPLQSPFWIALCDRAQTCSSCAKSLTGTLEVMASRLERQIPQQHELAVLAHQRHDAKARTRV
jgi:hypothetical protein